MSQGKVVQIIGAVVDVIKRIAAAAQRTADAVANHGIIFSEEDSHVTPDVS